MPDDRVANVEGMREGHVPDTKKIVENTRW
jgi:hypothetical protein